MEILDGVPCPDCQRSYKWKPELAGKRVKCKCGGRIQFPVEDPAAGSVGSLDIAAIMAEDDPSRADSADDSYAPMPIAPAKSATAAPMPAAPKPIQFCPSCTGPLAADAVICMRCGTNIQTGKKLGTKIKGPGIETAVVAQAASKMMASLILGGITAAVMAGAWVWIAYATNYQIGYVAWAIGLLTGGAIAVVNPNGGPVAGLAGAVFSLCSLGLAKLALLNGWFGVPIPASSLFTPIDIVFTLLALATAYRIASGSTKK